MWFTNNFPSSFKTLNYAKALFMRLSCGKTSVVVKAYGQVLSTFHNSLIDIF